MNTFTRRTLPALASAPFALAFILACAPTREPSGPEKDSTQAPKAELQATEAPGEEAKQQSAEGEKAPQVEEAAEAKTPLPEGTKVLHVGDSFAGALGLPLSKKLEAAGVRSILKHTDASYLTTWAWEGALQEYLWKYNPDLVIVTLGANELGIAQPEQRERTVKKIISTIGERPCVWVAIPLWNGKQNGLMDVIERSVGPCVFMDTNSLIDVAAMPRISDGIHPTSEARAEWAEFVFEWLETHRSGEPKPWSIRPE